MGFFFYPKYFLMQNSGFTVVVVFCLQVLVRNSISVFALRMDWKFMISKFKVLIIVLVVAVVLHFHASTTIIWLFYIDFVCLVHLFSQSRKGGDGIHLCYCWLNTCWWSTTKKYLLLWQYDVNLMHLLECLGEGWGHLPILSIFFAWVGELYTLDVLFTL